MWNNRRKFNSETYAIGEAIDSWLFFGVRDEMSLWDVTYALRVALEEQGQPNLFIPFWMHFYSIAVCIC